MLTAAARPKLSPSTALFVRNRRNAHGARSLLQLPADPVIHIQSLETSPSKKAVLKIKPCENDPEKNPEFTLIWGIKFGG